MAEARHDVGAPGQTGRRTIGTNLTLTTLADPELTD
jgi:hypothetical protein